ncbi:GDP-L-fucose synthase [uncultured Microbulbifer sp.]|uniref:GDP-L-fucose synthase family protein n=1 Tax=uncultured Microbulbifer sp. TaxID=348147 RepID=UPI002623CBB3|nr:GDP-L-fucose synthase [uncultured Microbulbifer sp.]
MYKSKRIFVAGHNGMVGSALVRRLRLSGHENIILKSKSDLNLIDQTAVDEFYREEAPDVVYIAAAKVGGIYANSHYPADFIYQNLMIQCNLIQGANSFGVQDLLFLGSSCIYPLESKQPITEGELLRGALEKTNEPYAIAKIAGIKLCESLNHQYQRRYRCVMPCNLYGPGDSFHPENSHVIPSLIYRFHTAKISCLSEVAVWGSGTPRREFLYVDDLASACLHVMRLEDGVRVNNSMPTEFMFNIGSGKDVSIAQLAILIADVVGYGGDIVFDKSKPDGTQRKLLDISVIRELGWKMEVPLREGIKLTYDWYVNNVFSK